MGPDQKGHLPPMFPPELRHWHSWQRALGQLAREPRTFAWKTHRLLRPMRPVYRRRFGMRLGQWLVYHNQTIAFTRCSWMGVQTLKNPLDAWIYQEILYEGPPDVVIEIGSYSGGSTLYLAHLLDLLGKGQVISIDIDRSHYQGSGPLHMSRI
jgi:protein-L-isoaspartate O-methyltransferase